MQVSPHRLLIPLLISFSLTGAGLVLIYFLNKQENEKNNKKKKIQSNFIEISIPRQFVPVIIGRGGSVIQNIQETTNTKISFKEETDVDLTERICLISGSFENIKLAEEKIKNILSDRPIIETYETFVVQRTIAKLTERGGELMNHIQNASNAKIILESSIPPAILAQHLDTKRRVIIKGTAEQIASALILIEDQVRKDNEARMKIENSSLTRIPRVKSASTDTSENNVKEVIYSKEMFDNQGNEGLLEVFVSAAESPNQFYIQVVGSANTSLDELTKEMSTYYEFKENRELHTLKNISIGQMVAAKFSVDNKWSRAEILDELGENTYEVYFADYGDHEKIDGKNIFELRTDFLSLRLQAIECSLAGVKPRDAEWSNEAVEAFKKMCAVATWQPRVAKIRGYKERVLGCRPSRPEGSPIPCIELYERRDDQLINIGKELINLELACPEDEPWSAASSTLSLPRRNQDPRARSPEVQFMATSNTNNAANNRKHNAVRPVEEIDLSLTPQPKKQPLKNNIEVIDLTSSPLPSQTYNKGASQSFIANERTSQSARNGNGDYARNMHRNKPLPANPFKQSNKSTVNIIPAGYEDENSEDDDDFEYN